MKNNIKLNHIFKYKFVSTSNKSEHIKIHSSNNINSYNKARDIMLDKYNISIREFESNWKIKHKKHIITFKNKPWNSKKELESDLLNINGIKNISDISYNYINKPLTYHICIKSNYSINTVKNNIKNYFEGLIVDNPSDELFVIVNPTKYIN